MSAIYQNLAKTLGLTWPTVADVNVTGQDPWVDSVFRVGECAAAALGAQAAAVSEIWRRRSGQRQKVRVDALAGALATFSVGYQSQHGYVIPQNEPSYPLVDLYPAKDGRWFFPHGAFPLLRNGLLELLQCTMDPHSIAEAIKGRDAQKLENDIADLGLCGAMVRSYAEWIAHPQGKALANSPLIEIIKIGDSAPEPFKPARRPLSGLRVLDLTHVIAGPTCGKTLAEQGATVMHVTFPGHPGLPPFDVDTTHGKLAALCDLKQPADAERMRTLIKGADVFAESYRPGGISKLGFDPAQVAALRPGIVYLSLNCYGWSGPWKDRPGWEQLAQVATGMTVAQGSASKPAIQPTYPNDYITGFLASLGILMALIRRADEGGSYHVRVSLCRTAMWVQDQGTIPHQVPPPKIPPEAISRYQETKPSPFGSLTYLRPVLDYEHTPSYWERMTEPLGASPAAWPVLADECDDIRPAQDKRRPNV
ncbi:MAG TPA: CoA transferase [Magnetospirillum sp.]|jgi:crotonobetainyl-CoA:carnitine CoA-transferase CaiB-like acyl-CoA transferase|nr:CoA transferase [Magnetospirillum sp.]